MLQLIIAIATRLYRIRAVLWLLGGAAAVVFLRGIAMANGTSALSLAGLIGVVWAGFLIALTHLFAHRRFDRPAAGASLVARMRWRLVLAAAWCAIAVLGALALVLVLFSLRALKAT